MTTPLDAGPDPDPPGERRGLESYPEFLAYPIDPDGSETAVMSRVRAGGVPSHQAPYSPPPGSAVAAYSAADEGIQPPAEPAPLYPETYIKDKPSADPAPRRSPRLQPQRPRTPRPQQQPSGLQQPSPLPRSPWPSAQPQPQPTSQPQSPQWQSPLQPHSSPQPQSPQWQSQPEPQPQLPSLPHPQSPSQWQSPPQQQSPQQQQSPAHPYRQSPPPPQAPRPPRPPQPRAPGRRRAKRSLAATLWPFHAHTRPAGTGSARIRSRSTTATVWRKLRADRAAVFGGCTIVVLILLAAFAPALAAAFGVDPNKLHPELTDATFGPHGGFGGISWSHPLGVDQRMGRDIMARLLYGARVSLLIAGGATLLSVGLGVALGVVSGYLGGRVDLVVMRIAEVFLAFPLMLFALGLTGALSDQAFGLSGNTLRIAIMIFVMGFFNWPYIARIVRGEVLSLREREFVDAARAMGATTRWIVWRELLPNLLAPILVYTTLLIPANIVFEAGLSALGIGLDPPASSWGQMMTDAVATVYTDPEYLIVPGMAVFITVLAFNLFGDGLRNATDPTAQ